MIVHVSSLPFCDIFYSMEVMKTFPVTRRFFVIAVALCAVSPAQSAIQMQFDYSYDISGFFAAGSTARSTLEAVGDFYGRILDDDLLAISSTSENKVTGVTFHPSTGELLEIPLLYVPADTVKVYVGAYDMGSNILGQAGPGGRSVSYYSSDWYVNVMTRGEGTSIDSVIGSTATEFAPWGGAMSIDSDSNWNLDYTKMPVAGQVDLYTVIVHELGHVLGLGTADSWDNLIADDLFTGDAVVAKHGGAVAVTSDHGHWAAGTKSTVFGGFDSQDTSMTPSVSYGKRKLFTVLDAAGLDDIGWDINYTQGAYGDANLDGRVDDGDAVIMAANWLKTGALWSWGDFDGNGQVNSIDAALMAGNWQKSANSTSACVPEAKRAVLLLSAFTALFACMRRYGQLHPHVVGLHMAL